MPLRASAEPGVQRADAVRVGHGVEFCAGGGGGHQPLQSDELALHRVAGQLGQIRVVEGVVAEPESEREQLLQRARLGSV